MKDLKTTVTGLITALATILAYFNIVIPADWIPIIIAVGTIILSYLTADKEK